MCNYDFKVKLCPVCNEGWIEIVKDVEANKLFLCCNECETEWSDPENITAKNGMQDNYGEIENPTIAEIRAISWEKYVIKK